MSASVLISEAGTVTGTETTSTTIEVSLATAGITTTSKETSSSTIDATTKSIVSVYVSETYTEPSFTALTAASTETQLTTDATIDTTSMVTEAATTSTKTESSTTTTAAEPPIQIVEITQNGGFDNSGTDPAPWTIVGATSLSGLNDEEQKDGSYCHRFGDFTDNTNARTYGVSQGVPVYQGIEYTLSAWIKQRCIFRETPDDTLDCRDTSNRISLTVDGVGSSSQNEISNDSQYHEFKTTLQYCGPEIEETDLCALIEVREGEDYQFFMDTISFAQGRQLELDLDEE
ncbi:hypothetical protein NW762_011126 [Fusarium torreyae]|uniref:CBM-cenC domain-containing protein n=1 Tax=Fusarium torreyae TaxID=1237075 RepID=A0A9W8RPU0_9HYPO|nr:hypothetical protein NW762_011126 [Fusarium torreyae]